MNRLLAVALLFLTSCSYTLTLRQPLNQELQASPGSPVVSWEFTDYRPFQAGNLVATLFYSGNEHDTVFMSYKEFYGPLATTPREPGMTQELRFDVSKDKTIIFRGCEIEVKTVAPNSLNYVIKKKPSPDLVNHVF